MAENARPQSAMELALLKQTHADRAIHVQVQQYVAETVAQLGGWSGIQVGDLAMLLSQKICLTIALALEAEVVANGRLSDDKGRPSALLAQMRAFQGEFRQNQIALGLARARITSRRAKDLNPSMSDILEEYQTRAEDTKARRKAM
jgi:hypothetical protein